MASFSEDWRKYRSVLDTSLTMSSDNVSILDKASEYAKEAKLFMRRGDPANELSNTCSAFTLYLYFLETTELSGSMYDQAFAACNELILRKNDLVEMLNGKCKESTKRGNSESNIHQPFKDREQKIDPFATGSNYVACDLQQNLPDNFDPTFIKDEPVETNDEPIDFNENEDITENNPDTFVFVHGKPDSYGKDNEDIKLNPLTVKQEEISHEEGITGIVVEGTAIYSVRRRSVNFFF